VNNVSSIEALQQENEQLRAQVARMKDEIEQRAEKYDPTVQQLETQNKSLLEQLANIHELQSNTTMFIPTNYHNSEDVEV
jgi:phage shock protein A